MNPSAPLPAGIQPIEGGADIRPINGGVCAPRGFSAYGLHAGIRRNRSKADLALILSSQAAATGAVYTQNLVKGAPLGVTHSHIAATGGYTRAVLCNSGNANTCTTGGVAVAEQTCEALATQLNIAAAEVAVASTGVIGEPLDPTPILRALPELVQGLSSSAEGAHQAAQAILTTDTHTKEVAIEFMLDDIKVRLGAMAKGSGMIHPNLATMLVFITSDIAITPELIQHALSADVASTFNMTSVDGDTSTNDMVLLQANGMAGNAPITSEDDPRYALFATALNSITIALCKQIAGDGEGATKLIECTVSGAASTNDARALSKSVITSSLVKAAMFGADANWGRVLCALGYAHAHFDPSGVDVDFTSSAGTVSVCRAGQGIDFSEDHAKKVLLEKEITINVHLHDGHAQATAWGCDLTYDYVRINGDYRT